MAFLASSMSSTIKGVNGEEIGFEPILRQISSIKDSLLDNNSIVLKYSRAIYDSFKKDLPLREGEFAPVIYEKKLEECKGFYTGKNRDNLLVLEEEIIKNELYRVTDGKRDFFWKLYDKEEDYRREERFFANIKEHGGHPSILKGHCSMGEDKARLLDNYSKRLYGSRKGILTDTYPTNLSLYSWSLQGSKKNTYEEKDFKTAITTIFNTVKWLHSRGWIHGNIDSFSVFIHQNQPILTSFQCSHPTTENSPCSNWNRRNVIDGNGTDNNNNNNINSNVVDYNHNHYEASDMWNLGSLISSMSANYYLLSVR